MSPRLFSLKETLKATSPICHSGIADATARAVLAQDGRWAIDRNLAILRVDASNGLRTQTSGLLRIRYVPARRDYDVKALFADARWPPKCRPDLCELLEIARDPRTITSSESLVRHVKQILVQMLVFGRKVIIAVKKQLSLDRSSRSTTSVSSGMSGSRIHIQTNGCVLRPDSFAPSPSAGSIPSGTRTQAPAASSASDDTAQQRTLQEFAERKWRQAVRTFPLQRRGRAGLGGWSPVEHDNANISQARSPILCNRGSTS